MYMYAARDTAIFVDVSERGLEKNAHTFKDTTEGYDAKSSVCAGLAGFWVGPSI